MRLEKAKIRRPQEKTDSIVKSNFSNRRISVYGESYKGEYYNIAIDKLIPFKNQTRKFFDEKSLDEMASTIKDHGIRQPLTVLSSEVEEGKYEIISGERRWKAAIIAGLKTVPCIIIHNRDQAEEVALIENLQRKNLHPLELMEGFQGLIDRKICKNSQEIAQKLGLSRSLVSETLNLVSLPKNTKALLIEKGLKSRILLRELKKKPESLHRDVINKVLFQEEEVGVKRVTKKTVKKTKIFNVYLKDEELIIDISAIMELTLEQKKELRDSLNEILKKI
jgi:ParB family chromosome partitioning protein